MSTAIDRTSAFAFRRLVESAGKMELPEFLCDVVETATHRIDTMSTDNDLQFSSRQWDISIIQYKFDHYL